VNGNGAFENEMDSFRRQKPTDDDLAAFARAVKVTLLEEPDRTAVADLIPRLAETARASAAAAPTKERPVAARRGWAPVLRVAIAVALVPLLSAGLAFAGVSLPGPANDAFETVGVELPNQAASEEDDDGAATGADEGGADEPGDEGLSNAEKRGHGKSKSNPARAGGRANGKNGRGRALGKRGLAPGQTKPKRSADGSQGRGNAVGRTGTTPPGKAKDKPAKGSDGSGGGSGKTTGKDKIK
jgi:hypothetical protein